MKKTLLNIPNESETENSYLIKRYNLREIFSQTFKCFSENSVTVSNQAVKLRAFDSVNISLKRFAEILCYALSLSVSTPTATFLIKKTRADFVISELNVTEADAEKLRDMGKNSGFDITIDSSSLTLSTKIFVGISPIIGAKMRRIIYNTIAYELSKTNKSRFTYIC